MCACLTVLFSCTQLSSVAQFIGLGQEKVKLTPEELQRLVYSSHVLTVLDDKPELEGGLLALRELHRENRQASPASLVKPVKWALEEYRKEASSRTVPVTWRDEVLGRYFLRFSEDHEEDPELPERRQVVLNLLNVLLAQQDPSDLLGRQAGLFHAESQRLLAVANGPGDRQALVESCTGQAQSDPNFAAAMDKLLEPDVKVVLNAPPTDILAANPALNNSPTMQELMRLSSSSKDGSVEITIDKLKGLFAAEVAVAREAVTMHQDLRQEIDREEEQLVRYPDKADDVAAIIQRHAEEQARQTGRIAASSAAAKKLSDMALDDDPGTARTLDIISKSLGLYGSGLAQLGGYATNPMGAVGGVFSLAGAGCQYATLFTDTRPPPEEAILKSVKLVGEMITDLSEEMEGRFDRVDQSLVYILEDLRSAVLLIGDVGHEVRQVRKDLLEAQASLNRLERELDSYLTAGFGMQLDKQINGDLGYQARTGKPMSYEDYVDTADGPENAFHTWAVIHAKNRLYSPPPANDDLGDMHLLAQLERRPLERNLNYINEFLKRLGVSSLPDGAVASVADWYAGASAYMRLAAENPQHFRRIDPKRLDQVIRAGTELEDFFRAMADPNLYEAVLTNYKRKLDAFHKAVDEVEERFGNEDFDVLMWRQWEARAPRVAVTETAIKTQQQYFPPIPTDVEDIAAGPYYCLALRANGTVVAWGDNRFGQCNIPPGLSDVIAVSAGASHSLALKKDGTIVAWGDDSAGQGNVPAHGAHTNITKIAAGDSHNLALGEDGRVIAWGNNSDGACDVPKGLTGVREIVAGHGFSLALKEDGTIEGWGQCKVPPGLSNVKAIAAGYGRAVAVNNDGTAVVWEITENHATSRGEAINGVTGVAEAALGNGFTVVRKIDGMVEVTRGGARNGVPLGARTSRAGLQVYIPALATAIAATRDCTLVLRDDGTVVKWPAYGVWHHEGRVVSITQSPVGAAPHGIFLLEHGLVMMSRLTGEQPPLDLGHVVAIASARSLSTVLWLKEDRPVRGIRGPYESVNVPNGLSEVVDIAVTRDHCLALRRNGTVEAWSTWPEEYVVPHNGLAGLDNCVAIRGCNYYSLALRANGTVVAWGQQTWEQGEVPMPSGLDNVVAIAVGDGHSLALRADGSVVAWGENDRGQCNIPDEAESNVVAIAAGSRRSLALKADGTVVAWGRQCEFAASQTGVLALADDGESLLVAATTPRIENAEPLHFVRGEPPRAVMLRLRELCEHVLPSKPSSDFNPDLNDNLDQLTGAKVLLESVIALGLPDSLDQDDVLRGLLFGSESLIDRDGARALYEAEKDRLNTDEWLCRAPIGRDGVRALYVAEVARLRTDEWRQRAPTFKETPRERLRLFREHLKERLTALEKSGTSEIPRMVAHTLLQLRLLRAAHPGNANVIN
jgi:alpha-tubulin suppressor-like RCC1 family protein